MRLNEAPPIETPGRQGAYLAKKCFEAAAKNNMPTAYPESLKLPHSPFTESLLASGLVYEETIGQRLVAEIIDHTALAMITEAPRVNSERTWEAKRQKETDTWNAYRNPAVRFIFNARIGGHFEGLLSDYLGTPVTDVNRISEPDAIELGPYLPNGLRAMRFVDVKDHKTTSGKGKTNDYLVSPLSAPFFNAATMQPFSGPFDDEDWMQLSHYYCHGQSLGLTDVDHSLWAAVIGREAVLVWARLDEVSFLDDNGTGSRTRTPVLNIYRNAFAHGIRVSLNGRQRDVVPSTPKLSQPERKEECRQCPWRKVCTAELTAYGVSGHITLLPGVTPPRAKAYYSIGVSSIGALAAMPLGQTAKGLRDKDIVQARVTMTGRVHKATGVDVIGLDRADIEVDFDCENDAQYYMWGIRTTITNSLGVLTNVRTYDDYTQTDEMGVFLSTWNYFAEVRAYAAAQGMSVRFYYYSHYEKTALRKIAAKYIGQPGVPTLAEVDEFYASEQTVDLRPIMEEQLVWPVESFSLKVLAKHAGFGWRDETPGGDESMVWYRVGCSDPDPSVRASNIDRLRKYNEDDCEAQVALRNWIRDNEVGFVSADSI